MATACKVSAALALPTALSGKRVESSSSVLGGSSLRLPGREGRQRGWRRACARCDASHAGEEPVQQVDTKEFRHRLVRGENYNKSGWGYKQEMLKQMDVEYTSKFLGA